VKFKTKIILVIPAVFLLLGLLVWGEQQPPEKKEAPVIKITKNTPPTTPSPATDMEKLSYTFGVQIGQTFKNQQIEVSVDQFTHGFRDALMADKFALTVDEMRDIVTKFQQTMMEKQKAQMEILKQQAEKNLADSIAFLEANKKDPLVKVLPSGLQYKVLTEGTGPTPTAEDRVKTHYRGTLITGEEFDSSYKKNEPLVIGVNQVIKGWTEALQLMKVGDKWQLFIPPDLAYGEKPRTGIPPNSLLIFEVELLEIVK